MPKIDINTIERIARKNIRDAGKVEKLMANLRELAITAEEEKQNRNKYSERKVALIIPPTEGLNTDREYTIYINEAIEDDLETDTSET